MEDEVTDNRDLRDPEKVGNAYLAVREKGLDIEFAVDVRADEYVDNGGIAAEQAAKYAQEFPEGLPVNDDPSGA